MAERRADFYDVLTQAINDFLEHGFDTEERLNHWIAELRRTVYGALVSEAVLAQTLRASLSQTFKRATSAASLTRVHPGIDAYTLERIKPTLRAELDRRILSSASLIKLNRDASIQKTLQRFAGWATSIPIGGTEVTQRAEAKENIRRGIAALSFEERRVVIDQGHKLASSINDIVATDGGAIAAIWHSHWRQGGYDYRQDHKDRDEELFVIRGNWALADGLMKLAGAKYTDQITAAGEEPFCRCFMTYVYHLRDLPEAMRTAKGKEALKAARATISGR